MFVDGKQMKFGKNGNLQSFWMDGDQNNCYDWFLGTNQITIQNGQGMFHNLFTSQFRDLTYLQQIETIEKLYHLIAIILNYYDA